MAAAHKSIYAVKEECSAAEFRTDDLGGKSDLRNVYVTSSVELYPMPSPGIFDWGRGGARPDIIGSTYNGIIILLLCPV